MLSKTLRKTSLQEAFRLFIFFILFSCAENFILGCSQNESESKTINFSITSPKQGWTYYENTRVILAVNLNTENITWSSNTAGFIGNGNHLTVFLPQGLHRIKADIDGYSKELSVYISQSIDNIRSVLINYSPMEIKLKEGNYFSYLFSHNGSVNNFKMSPITSTQNNSENRKLRLTTLSSTMNMNTPNRDIRLPMPEMGKPAFQIRQRSVAVNSYTVGDKRSFFVIKTDNQTGTPHNPEAELVYQSEVLAVWLADGSVISTNDINECVKIVETLIIPRVYALWGKASDIDNDGRITLLFSSTLNNEGVLGFFNPADFFMRNEDVTSQSYNPSSNEMDIIYVALPVNDSKSYTPASINATIAHELTHTASFTVKTWNRIKNGNTNAAREELFLDEGWSHLTENLCGLGISGGNINFVKTFFENTSAYSFCGPNKDENADSNGMRGAITLFLSWLFWEAGGMSWDSSDSVKITDQGGMSFLKKMVESPYTGWESIGTAFGKPVSQLFNEFLNEMHNYRISNNTYNYKIDPFTNEAVDFFVNMGEPIGLGFPKPSSVFEEMSLLPWSFSFKDNFSLQNETLLTLKADNTTGSVFYSYILE